MKNYAISKTLLVLLCLVLPTTVLICPSCRQIKKLKNEIGEFNESFDDLVKIIDAQSDLWRETFNDQNETWQDLVNNHSDQWQEVVQDESGAWRDLFSDKSDEWLAEVEEFRKILFDFQGTSQEFVDLIREINDNLPNHIQLAAKDIEKALNNASGNITANILCVSEILEGKIHRELQQIKEELGLESSNSAYRSIEDLYRPRVCSSDQASIDLQLPQNHRREIVITGHGFQDAELEVVFVSFSGVEQPQPHQLLFKNSNYRLVVGLSFLNDNFLRLYQKMAVVFEGETLIEFPIYQ